MPLVSQDQLIRDLSPIGGEINSQPQQEDKDVPVSDAFKAAFQSEGIVGSVITKGKATPDIPTFFESKRELDPDFSPWDSIEGYEDSADAFTYTNNLEEVEQVKRFVDIQRDNRQILQDSGWVGIVASISAGILDPTILIPGAAGVKGASLAARSAKGLVAGTALGGVSVGTQEGVLQATQTERTFEESTVAIASAGILGGIGGAALSAMSRASRKGAEASVASVLDGKDLQIKLDQDSISVAKAGNTALQDEGLARINDHLVGAVTGPKILQSPTVRGLRSPFATHRQATNDLFEHNFILGKNLKGEATDTSVETLLKQDQARVVQLNTTTKNAYSDYVGVKPGAIGQDIRSFIAGKAEKKMTFAQFNEEVDRALRRGDVHEVPQVQAAAKAWRKEIDSVTKELQEIGVLGDELDPKTATSWFTRRYNTDKIIQDEDVFKDILERNFRKANPQKSDMEIGQAVQDTYETIIGIGDQRIQASDMVDQFSAGAKPKFTKERVLNISDEELDDFLIHDALGMGSNYIMQAKSMIHMQRALEKRGHSSVNDLRQSLKDEFNQQKLANPEKGPELTKQFKESLDLLNDQVDIMLGRFGKNGAYDDKLRLIRKYNVTTLLGGVTLSSIPDIAMPVFRHGLPKTIQDGYLSTVRNLSASKLAKDDLKHIGVGLELEENQLLRNLTDPDYRLGTTPTNAERFADTAMQGFGKISLMTYWNNFHKRLAGHVSSARTIKTALRGTVSESEKLRLATIGIDERMLPRIKEQFQKFGTETDGSFIANFEKWTDKEAKDIFGQSILRDVDSTILSPGKGDLPLVAQSSELGKTIFQFKSFSATATNRLVLSGMQRRDAEVISGFVGLLGMGAATYAIKESLRGRTPNTDPDTLLMEGMTRSGVLGLFGEYIAGLNPMSHGASRYAGRNAQSILFGPTSSLVADAFQTMARFGDGEITESDKRKLLRFTPFQNVFYLRLLLDKAFEAQKLKEKQEPVDQERLDDRF